MRVAKRILLVGLILGLTGLGLPQVASAAGEYDPKLVAAAKAEGEVVFYTSLSRTVSNKIVKRFAKKFGIKVKHVRKGTNKVIAMIEAERQAGIKRVDAFSFSDPALMFRWRDKGRLMAYQPAGADKFEKRFKDPKGTLIPLLPLMVVMAYHKGVVSENQAPKSWADLTNPRWKGMIGHSDPAYSGTTAMTIFVLKEKFGWDYYRKIAANKPLLGQSIGTIPKMMATKEAPIGALALAFYVRAQINKGQPFKIVYPKEGTITYVHYGAIPKTAPHPNAARLFLSYYTSRENQTFLANLPEAFFSVRTDVKSAPGNPDLSTIKFIEVDFDKFKKEKKNVIKTFKKILAEGR